MTARRRGALPLIALLVIALLWGGLYVARTSFAVGGERVFTLWDDAMISMQYARNLRNGDGLVWIAGREAVQGFTNLGVTLAMAALHGLPLAAERAALPVQLLALLAFLATVAAVATLARRLRPGDPPFATAAALATVLCAPVAIWGLQGSDVGFVTLWLVGSAALVAGPAPRRGAVLAVLGLGLWIRPDSLLFYLPLLACAVVRAGGDRRLAGAGIAIAVATVGLQLGFGQLYYGDPLPNTFYLKATGAPRLLVLAVGAGELLAWLPHLLLPIALAAVFLRREFRNPIALLCAALVAVGHGYNLWVGGDFIFGYGSRFAVPTLPFLLLLALGGCRALFDRFSSAEFRESRRFGVAFAATAAAVSIVANPLTSTLEWLDPVAPTMHRADNENNYRFARYLRENTAASTLLAAHWGGVPVYFSGRPAVDVLGKSDRHIARLAVDRFVPGHSKWDWDYVLKELEPDVFRAPSRGLGERQDFRETYYKVVTPDGLGFFLRRSSVAKLSDRNVALIDLVTGERARIRARRRRPSD